jgi:hypothetical protein
MKYYSRRKREKLFSDTQVVIIFSNNHPVSLFTPALLISWVLIQDERDYSDGYVHTILYYLVEL